MTFTEQVYAAVRQIPTGETRTYKQIAVMIGKPGAARAVGTALRKNQDTRVPCHRVVKSDGTVGAYNGLQGSKAALLEAEQLSTQEA